jgi:hypothetical protein
VIGFIVVIKNSLSLFLKVQIMGTTYPFFSHEDLNFVDWCGFDLSVRSAWYKLTEGEKLKYRERSAEDLVELEKKLTSERINFYDDLVEEYTPDAQTKSHIENSLNKPVFNLTIPDRPLRPKAPAIKNHLKPEPPKRSDYKISHLHIKRVNLLKYVIINLIFLLFIYGIFDSYEIFSPFESLGGFLVLVIIPYFLIILFKIVIKCIFEGPTSGIPIIKKG